MALVPGFRLSAYEIVGQIGAGGMGLVYRARDVKLQRDVALKVLPDALAEDPGRLARFQREAQVLASLNHPNIAHIHGFEEHGSVRALVIELVEGDDLSELIARGALPLDHALAIARQIADALDAAHQQGIVHRDLKPANVKVRPDGMVKVLDFGLAKLAEAAAGSSPASLVTSPAQTANGVILGTAGYMSPEQAKGLPTDRRTDVWAFGCVLFEMLTGRSPFGGSTMTEILAGVIKSDPDWAQLPPDTPPSIVRLLRRALTKDESRRLRDIADARLEIDEARAEPALPLSPAASPLRRNERIVWLAMVVALAIAMGVVATRVVPAPPKSPEVQVDLNTPPVPDPGDLASFAVSPDGQKVVFAGVADGQPKLLVRSLASVTPQPLPGTEGGLAPFWSADSRSVGFFVDTELKRIDLDGGLARTIATGSFGTGGSWNRDGTILFTPNPGSPVLRVSAEGGAPTPVTRKGPGHAGHQFPHFLPDGRHFLYFVAGAPDVRGVHIGQLDTQTTRKLFDSEAGAIFAAGHLLFIRQTTLFAHEFDADRLELKGTPFRVAEGVLGNSLFYMPLSASPAGTLAMRIGSARRQNQLIWIDRSGAEVTAVGEPNIGMASLSPSPDGSRIVVNRVTDNPIAGADLWFVELRRGMVDRFTTDQRSNMFASWSRRGDRIAYGSQREGGFELHEKRTTGSDTERLLVPATGEETMALDWSPDDRVLLFQRRNAKTGWDIWTLPLEGGGAPRPLIQTDADERAAFLSPDGKWIAYYDNGSGRFEVYVQPFSGQGSRAQVSTRGGSQVRWNANGRELFYVAPDSRLMAAPIHVASNGQSVEAGTPVPLFATRIGHVVSAAPMPEYFVSNDGQRFLMNTILPTGPVPIRLILNWTPLRR